MTSSTGMQDVVAKSSRNNTIIRWAMVSVAALVALLLFLLVLLIVLSDTGFVGLLAGMVLAILPLPIYLTLVLWIDRYEKEPLGMLAMAFVWGAVVAVFFSLIFNTLNGLIVTVAFGKTAGAFFGPVISAPLVEESSKGLALFILYWWKKDEFDGVIDGIVYAAMVGLGFAMTENFLYYGRAIASGSEQAGLAGATVLGLILFMLRGVISPFSHPIFTSMTGIGLGLARQSDKTYVKFIAPVVGLLMAMFLHSLWNFTATVIDPLVMAQFSSVFGQILAAALIGLLLTLFMLSGLLVVIFFSLRREGRIVRQYLTPELQNGLLAPEECGRLSSVTGRIGLSMKALTKGGLGEWRERSQFNQAASELAFQRNRVARGITSPGDATREAAYLQLLKNLKGRLGN